MIATIQPSALSGTVRAPASKSSMQRACAAALLHRGSSVIHNPGNSNDDKAAVRIIGSLGADVKIMEDRLLVHSTGFPAGPGNPGKIMLDCGESGLSIRMFTPIAALSGHLIRITGSGSLLTRPLDFFDTTLPRLGATIKSNTGKLPLEVQGPLQPASIDIDGSQSSQYLTGLLMAFAAHVNPPAGGNTAAGKHAVIIKVSNLKSKPYIDLTLDVMKKFGLNVPAVHDYEEFTFTYAAADIPPAATEVAYTVEGDWSGGAFLLVAGAIAGPVRVTGLDLTSPQADKAVTEALMLANAGIAMDAKGIVVHPGDLQGFRFDATDCPDLFPPLVALAAYCKGQTRIRGTNRLLYKESNRALTLQEEFGKMNVAVTLDGDEMIIEAADHVLGATVHSHHDHRVAMACAVAALGAKGETCIEEALAVRKSYPDFYQDLQKLGAAVSLPYHHFNF